MCSQHSLEPDPLPGSLGLRSGFSFLSDLAVVSSLLDSRLDKGPCRWSDGRFDRQLGGRAVG